MKYKSSRGFTLIELLIVIVVLSLLTVIATVSYQDSVRKARRGDAKAVLLELAQLMERNYTETNRFDKDTADADYSLPFNTSPKDGTKTYYNITLPTPTLTSQTFILQAAPTGTQRKDTRCMTLTLDNTGTKGMIGGSSTAAECWAR